MVIESQLKKAGFNIDFQIFDWATLVARRVQPKLWDIFQTAHGFVPDPILYTLMSDADPGWWTTDKKTRLTNEFTQAIDPKQRKAIWDQIQALIYEEVPICKTGDQFTYNIYSPKVQGIGATQLIWPKLWGVSFK